MTPQSTPVRLTGLQKLVRSLAKAGYKHREIAERLGVSRQAVSQAVRRGIRAEEQIKRSFASLVE